MVSKKHISEQDVIYNGELITIGLGITENIYFEGTCYIESLTIDNASDDSPTISIEFAGSNAIVFTNTTV